jgi:hypothetical protein
MSAFITKVKNTIRQQLSGGIYRLIKVVRLGNADVQEVDEVAPFGVDANPIEDMEAIYLETSTRGGAVIVGYMNRNQLADKGEVRLYSVDSNGMQKTFIWLKKDGTIEIGGTTDNAVRYAPLNEKLQQLVTFLNQELGKISVGISGAGGSYTPGTATLDISGAKIDNITTS